jgi:TM2 domain-containing membrane protein YozV
MQPSKNPGLAAVLSFFVPGLGQIYNGQIAKGLVLLVAFGISAAATAFIIGWLTTPLLWVWGIYDAYRTAQGINDSPVGA